FQGLFWHILCSPIRASAEIATCRQGRRVWLQRKAYSSSTVQTIAGRPAWVHGGASVCNVHMPKEGKWRLSVWYLDIRVMTTRPWKNFQTRKRVLLTGSCKCIAVRRQTKKSSPNSSTTHTSIGGILIDPRVASRPPL